MHHRRLDLEIATRDEELAHRLHDLRAGDEHASRFGAGDQIDVALPVLLLLIGEAVELLGQRAQRLGEQPQLCDPDRKLAGARLEQCAPGADDVAQVPVLERFVRLDAEGIIGDVELDAAAHVLQRGEARLAHDALEHHTAGDCNSDGRRLERFVGLPVVRLVQRSRERVATEVVRVRRPALAHQAQLRTALRDDLVFALSRRVVAHGLRTASAKERLWRCFRSRDHHAAGRRLARLRSAQ